MSSREDQINRRRKRLNETSKGDDALLADNQAWLADLLERKASETTLSDDETQELSDLRRKINSRRR